MISWAYLSDKPQFVSLCTCLSEHMLSNIGAPQGTLHPVHHRLLEQVSATFRNILMTLGWLCASGVDRDMVNNFIEWCGENHLLLTVAKTKEIVVDYRRTITSSITIMGQHIELVDAYRNLDNKLDWKVNSETV